MSEEKGLCVSMNQKRMEIQQQQITDALLRLGKPQYKIATNKTTEAAYKPSIKNHQPVPTTGFMQVVT